jgi:hypothetical protein
MAHEYREQNAGRKRIERMPVDLARQDHLETGLARLMFV